jgi:membrane-bound lytic murein transglycosylase D
MTFTPKLSFFALCRRITELGLLGVLCAGAYAQELSPVVPFTIPAVNATEHTPIPYTPYLATPGQKAADSPSVLEPIAATQEIALTESYQTLDADLWARIRRGFAMPDLKNAWVNSQEQWYATRPDYIGRMTTRSSKYLYHIVEELERRNMPTELALLPFIESAFNPKAVSSAKAAGMWQFIPSTGKDFSLKQNQLRDDRRDVLASTRAALDYLQKLYGMFGDWHLALAAYNWGEGSVGRAQAKNKRAGLGLDYTSLKMPDETRNYVPKLQAVKNIVSDPAVFNVQLPEIPNHPYFKSVPIAKDVDVALAAKLAEIGLEDFKSLNPSANKPTIFAAGTPYILLPWDNVGIFQRNLAIHNGQTAGWTVWTAPSVTKVADAARRFSMSEAQFREINSIPPRMLIKAGSTLLVPRSAHQSADVSEHVADNAQLSLQAEVALVKRRLTITKPESLAAFAKRTGQSAANVAAWNNVSLNASFKPKQTVVIWVPQKARQGKKVGPSVAVKKKMSTGSKAQSKTATKTGSKKPTKAKAKKPSASPKIQAKAK